MYNLSKPVDLSYERAVEKAKEELQKEGFGVLTEIDVKATLKKKLNVDFDRYIILGACNPPFAYKALQAEKEIGLMMPCNVVVYESSNRVHVAAVLPTAAMGIIKNPQLTEVASQVEAKLRKVISSI